MDHQKAFLVVIEATPGLNTHCVYATLEEAQQSVKKSASKGELPICIYNLNTSKYIWNDRDFPAYGETIAEATIRLYK